MLGDFGYLGSYKIRVVEQPFRGCRQGVVQAGCFSQVTPGRLQCEFVLLQSREKALFGSLWRTAALGAVTGKLVQRLRLGMEGRFFAWMAAKSVLGEDENRRRPGALQAA